MKRLVLTELLGAALILSAVNAGANSNQSTTSTAGGSASSVIGEGNRTFVRVRDEQSYSGLDWVTDHNYRRA